MTAVCPTCGHRIPEPDALSPMQEKVAALAPTMTVDGMAAELFLSRNTVKTHLRAVYRKLGVQSRDELRAAS